ncbi:hypothetical protein N7V09_02570 [Shewanella seohaensis]|nr:hypothetical protein N7V09_02570 [Shewanella seohaensis]
MTTPANAPKWPRQIPYIIASEACERFSFYGMRNILTPFLMTALLLSIPEELRGAVAKDVFHSFVIGVYFSPYSVVGLQIDSLVSTTLFCG